MNEVKVLTEPVERDAKIIVCSCGGAAVEVETTAEENKTHGCGRAFACCARAFVCKLCGTRLVGTAEAQEME